MLFVSIGDNTIINLKFIQSIDFNDERTEIKVHWFSWHTRVYTGSQARELITKVLNSMPEHWARSHNSPPDETA